MDVASIQSINGNNDISMNYNETFIHKYYAPFLTSNNDEDVSSVSEYYSAKLILRRNKNIIMYLLSNISKSLNGRYHCYFVVVNEKKLSSHMAYISEHINSSNQKNHFLDQMEKLLLT